MKKTLNAICISLLLCGCTSKFTPESLVGDNWHTVLNIKNNGEQELTLNLKSETATFDLVILKTGSEKNTVSRAMVKVMDYSAVSEIFQYGDYTILDSHLFDFNPVVEFSDTESGKYVSVNLKQKQILEEIRNHTDTKYILPLTLVSDRDSVNVNKNCTFLSFLDGDISKKISTSGIEVLQCDLASNGYGNFGIGNLFDGDLSSVWRTIFWDAKAVNCDLSGGDPTALWCNREDHDVTDYIFFDKFTNKVNGEWIDCYRVDLPWTLVIDLKNEYDLTRVGTTVPRIVENGVDMSSFYQRIKDYEFWISTDNSNWELFASGTLPVYGDDTAVLDSDNPEITHPARYVKYVIKTLHWRENTEEEMKALHNGKAYDEYHDASFCSSAQSVAKDPDYAKLKKSAAVSLGPVILAEMEFWAKEIQ